MRELIENAIDMVGATEREPRRLRPASRRPTCGASWMQPPPRKPLPQSRTTSTRAGGRAAGSNFGSLFEAQRAVEADYPDSGGARSSSESTRYSVAISLSFGLPAASFIAIR